MRIKQIILPLMVLVATLTTLLGAASNSQTNAEAMPKAQFLENTLLEELLNERQEQSKRREIKQQLNRAINQSNWGLALICCDSLISKIEQKKIPASQLSDIYHNRAQILNKLGRNIEACTAFELAINQQITTKYSEHDDAAHELQATFELDKLALDKALLKAQYQRTALISVVVLLIAIILILVAIYITNRRTKSLQLELLQQISHAKESENQKLAFINSMCHEVRTPLNCLIGFSELLCSGEITPEVFSEYHDIIRDSRHQLRYVFDDILEVAYLENLTTPLPRTYINITAQCRAQIRALRVRYPHSPVSFSSDIPNDEIGMNSNEKYITMLLAELLDNGQKFSDGGVVHLQCGREGDDHVFISVTDNGRGIPIEQQQHIFERFVKLDTFSQGNGLGLYLCWLITNHLNGIIRVDPDYTQGTRIEVILPR